MSATSGTVEVAEAEMASGPRPREAERLKTVLLVDDNPVTLKLLRVLVQSDGYDTVLAEDGLEGLAALAREPVDVIISDLLMPNMDGYSFCSAVRQRSEYGHIPFVLCTSLQLSAKDEAFAVALGTTQVLTHHGSIRMVLKAIEEVTATGHRAPPMPDRPAKPVRVNEVMKQYSEWMIRELEEQSVQLEVTQRELSELNKVLEQKVHERTLQLENANRELTALNRELERRVEERTTELASKQRNLALRTEELARSNADLEQFASVASHDLQEPLRAVAGCVQIFQRKYAGKLDAQGDELIGMIVDGTARMKALISGLLEYSRAGQTQAKETIDTAVVLDEALANLTSAIHESKAEIIAQKLPSLQFAKLQFMQVLQNLLGNALKYRGKAPPQIRIEAAREGESWVFRVADNGIGFEAQFTDKVFAVFQRLHTREEYGGTGIGLSIVKKIVERRGGKIWVESVPGQGSTFSFSVPDRPPSAERDSPEPSLTLKGDSV
ncbi:MAG TPA: ATP-binding protein [Chthoniobacterales bacterium]